LGEDRSDTRKDERFFYSEVSIKSPLQVAYVS
jgi:hypothetical protein